MERIVECVPNFSEGRNQSVIQAITDAIAGVSCNIPCMSSGNAAQDRVMPDDCVKILHTDRGEAANRTVITFAGSPEAVVEAAFRGVSKAAELIDMRTQHGTHPRSGATDVLPLVPVRGVSLEECAAMARQLAGRIFTGLGIPCYCYEAAAFRPERKRLEVCRSGEYEALAEKIADPLRRPDFSPDRFNDTVARSGAINVGARDFLIAVNFNLDSRSAETAAEIARDVRESGRILRKQSVSRSGKGNEDMTATPEGTTAGSSEETVRIPGTLKGCKAIGWYIEEYGIAQVSMNITDINARDLRCGECEKMSDAAVRRLSEAAVQTCQSCQRCQCCPAAAMQYSMTFRSGMNGLRSSSPILFTAASMRPALQLPAGAVASDRKYSPASSRTFSGTSPIISVPVTLTPRADAALQTSS